MRPTQFINPYQRKKERIATMKDHAEHCMGERGLDRRHFGWYQIDKMIQQTGDRFIPDGLDADALMERILAEPRGKAVTAYINQNRWVATCECGGCEVVDPDDPVFFCLNPLCLNMSNKHYPRPVKFPKNREAIEDALLVRPEADTRNWYAYETVEQLEKQNTAHGLPKNVSAKNGKPVKQV